MRPGKIGFQPIFDLGRRVFSEIFGLGMANIRVILSLFEIQKLHVLGWISLETAIAPTQIRLRRICGILRAPNGALGYGAMAGQRVVFGAGLS